MGNSHDEIWRAANDDPEAFWADAASGIDWNSAADMAARPALGFQNGTGCLPKNRVAAKKLAFGPHGRLVALATKRDNRECLFVETDSELCKVRKPIFFLNQFASRCLTFALDSCLVLFRRVWWQTSAVMAPMCSF